MAGFGSNPSPERDQPSTSPSRSKAGAVRHILVIEDNPADLFLIREAIKSTKLSTALRSLENGEQAIKLFEELDRDESKPCPELVLLDINLPKRSGGEVLQFIRVSRRCSHTPVLIVSTAQSQRDRDEMMDLGATDYFGKTSHLEEFMRLGDVITKLLNPSR